MKFLVALVCGLLLMACVESREHAAPKPPLTHDAGACQDPDGDGYGEGCDKGGDCNESDNKVHTGCLQCTTPAQGCPCADSSKPLSCYRTPTEADDGTVMCHEGTRYCRAGQWSACESVVSYPKPIATESQALVKADAGPEHCNDCNITCFVIRDNLDPVDGGIPTATNTQQATSGLSLKYVLPDGGVDGGTTVFDPRTCVLGTAPDHDCDGIPDTYDPYPNAKPFATANPTIFLDIAPGETGTGVIDLSFYLNSADVYFLVDQTGSMAEESANLKAGLTTGDFVNNAAYNCADYDFDLKPNNELKSLGIVGAIRCIIRDANFGVGFFREIPFDPYADTAAVAFRNLLDISSDINTVIAGVGKLTTVSNIDWPEASMVGLYTLVTGNGLYFGPDRLGVPTRAGCPSLTWGYPCFRNNAIPIVLFFTDAQFHNGPSTNTYAYNSANLTINQGTSTTITQVNKTNEAYATAYDLGDMTNKFLTFVGDTTGMASDLNHTQVSCGSSTYPIAPDAFYKFTLSSTKSVTLSTEGSDFDTTLSLYRGAPGTLTALSGTQTTNDTGASAYSFGDITNKYVQASGSSSGLAADYSANDISCGSAVGAKDATFTFSLGQTTHVALDTAGSGYGTTMAVFSGTPAVATTANASNTNDTLLTPDSVGSLNGKYVTYSGTTTAAGITANYTQAQLGCNTTVLPLDAAPDAVYSFTLATATRVRASSEGSTVAPALVLLDNGGTYATSANIASNDTATSPTADIGTLDGKSYLYSGSTTATGMTADYTQTTTGCNAGDASKDAVFKFTLGSSKTVVLDTTGSSFDTSLSLFRSSITGPDTPVTMSSNTNETSTLAYDLGVANTKKFIVSGGDTTGLAADYTATQIGCTTSSGGRDAAYKFHLNTATRVRVDTIGSSFDTVLSLHNGLLFDPVTTTLSNTNDKADSLAQGVAPTSSSPNLRYDGNTSGLGTDITVDDGAGCSATGKDAVFKLDITTAGTYQIDTSTSTSSFDTVLGLYPSTISNPTAPSITDIGSGGDVMTSSGAVDVGVMDDAWKSYKGDTTSLNNDSSSFNSCSASKGTKDAYFKFTLNSKRTIIIDTIGTTLNTVIALFSSGSTVTSTPIGCDDDSGGGVASEYTAVDLAAGTYYVLVKGKGKNAAGKYQINFRDTANTSNLIECNDDGGSTSGQSLITRTLSVGTYYVIVKGKTTNDKGYYRLAVRMQSVVDGANRLYCNDDLATGVNASKIEQDLGAGDYWVVVKGFGATNYGGYTLTVQDITTPPTASLLTCNDNASTGVTTSYLSQSLTAGTYYAVVKGTGTNGGNYKLYVRDASVSAPATLACDYTSGATGSALIEQDLAAGTYKVVVKNRSATTGAYKLSLRDLTAVPTQRLACDHNSGTGSKSYLETDLNAGTYTVVLGADTSAGAGTYKLSVRDASNIALTDTALYCDNDSGAGATSRLTQTLTAGTYYAAVKGYRTTNYGNYQFSVGGAALTSGTYTPPTWENTLAALQAKGVYVLPVLSCKDDPYHGDTQGDCVATRTQATALASATNTLGANLKPLVFDITSNGNGLSKTVVDGVSALAHYLEMNVQVRVVFDPDPNPGFGLTIKAVDEPGDGCNGLSGIEHLHCAPGASPRFEIAFLNDAAHPVPANPKDPNGGYNFRAELIGDNQFIVDKVPIYIIPKDVSPVPVPQVVASGSYWQDVSSPGCVGNQTPDWHDLSWSADVPTGTTLSFNVCASDKSTDLATCPLIPLCTITGGAACTTDSQCTNGFCSTAGNCNVITASTCKTDLDCFGGARCRSGKCTYTGQPVYVGATLGIANNSTNLRMQLGMTANTTANTSPVVHDWSLTYVCNNTL